jgi:hypothetical protein
MSDFVTRKSIHGKAIHPPKLRGAVPPSHGHYVTVTYRCAGAGGWHLYETATVLATAHQGGTVGRAEVDIASKSQRGDTKTTLAQIH